MINTKSYNLILQGIKITFVNIYRYFLYRYRHVRIDFDIIIDIELKIDWFVYRFSKRGIKHVSAHYKKEKKVYVHDTQ